MRIYLRSYRQSLKCGLRCNQLICNGFYRIVLRRKALTDGCITDAEFPPQRPRTFTSEKPPPYLRPLRLSEFGVSAHMP